MNHDQHHPPTTRQNGGADDGGDTFSWMTDPVEHRNQNPTIQARNKNKLKKQHNTTFNSFNNNQPS